MQPLRFALLLKPIGWDSDISVVVGTLFSSARGVGISYQFKAADISSWRLKIPNLQTLFRKHLPFTNRRMKRIIRQTT